MLSSSAVRYLRVSTTMSAAGCSGTADMDELDREVRVDAWPENESSTSSIDSRLELIEARSVHFSDDDSSGSSCCTLTGLPLVSSSKSLLTISEFLMGRVMVMFDLLVDGPRLGL